MSGRDDLPRWDAASIGRVLSRGLFDKRLLVVDRCNWTGNECDLLVVTTDLRIVDIEIKISRADLKADASKDKWFDYNFRWAYNEPRPAPKRRDHPRKVWKHYYVMPASVWDDALFCHLGSPASGVIILTGEPWQDIKYRVRRRATPNRSADRITAGEALDIARLASLRMWDAYERAYVNSGNAP